MLTMMARMLKLFIIQEGPVGLEDTVDQEDLEVGLEEDLEEDIVDPEECLENHARRSTAVTAIRNATAPVQNLLRKRDRWRSLHSTEEYERLHKALMGVVSSKKRKTKKS